MNPIQPIYTAQNCRPAYQLNWSYSLFWRQPAADAAWLPELQALIEQDGIRVLQHTYRQPHVSQFLLSTRPEVAPVTIVARMKGRLQHLLRHAVPRAFRRNYSLRSIGSTRREKLDAYLRGQRGHHPMADPRVLEKLERFQLEKREVDLSQPRYTAHAQFIYNLHLVLVNAGRWNEIREDLLEAARHVLLRASAAKGHLLSRAAILCDHIHLMLGCGIDEAPFEIALSYMNNLAHTSGMRPVLSFSCFLGTFGEYDLGAIPRDSAESFAPPGQARRGRARDAGRAASAESVPHRGEPGGGIPLEC
jgi:REP element-mobilizing transposase RayT